MSRVTATDRVQRILAVLPWILQHQGATVDMSITFRLETDGHFEPINLTNSNAAALLALAGLPTTPYGVNCNRPVRWQPIVQRRAELARSIRTVPLIAVIERLR